MRIWNFKERANMMWQVMGMPKNFLLALAFSLYYRLRRFIPGLRSSKAYDSTNQERSQLHLESKLR
jgi:hypothetical protein